MNILALGAHPDDIEIGCGGTLLSYVAKGHNVYLFIVTRGEVGGDPGIRRQEQEASAQAMGVKKVLWGEFEDTLIPDDRTLIMAIEKVIAEVAPDIVFVNHGRDVHQDHRALAKACLSATRYIKEVLYYEVPTTEHFTPETFVNINDVFEQKLALLKIHASQINRTRVDDLSILEIARAMAHFRGFQARVRCAEAFCAVRILKQIS